MTTPIQHGGDPSGVRARLGLGGGPLLDFSASLNPIGPPPAAVEAARRAIGEIGTYPEPGCPRLVEFLAERHRVPIDRIIVGAGTTELIGLIAQSLRDVLALHSRQVGDPDSARAHLVEPSYTEYRRASVLNGLRTQVWREHVLGWSWEAIPKSATGIFWTGHPNNPTGRAWDRDRLLKAVDQAKGLLTVVDEGFLPFLADEADRTAVGAVARRENLLVLRSLSKFYAIPGLRVGYAVGPPDMIVRLRQYQDPWTVTAPAEAAALAALADEDYRRGSIARIAAESARLLEGLWEIPGLRPAWPSRERPESAPPLPNFVLVSLTETDWTSVRLHEALARRGILARECSDFPGLEVGALLTGQDQLVATQGHLRFAVRSTAENDLLLTVLRELLTR